MVEFVDGTTDVAIYARGGGFGHLFRALALARRITRRRERRNVAILAQPGAIVAIARTKIDLRGIRLIEIPPTVTPQASAETLAAQLASETTLVVDTFPRGVVGEISQIVNRHAGPRVLIHRDVDPRYLELDGVRAAFDAYDLVLVPGEDAPRADAERAFTTAPWLILDHDELLPRHEARRALIHDADDQRPIILLADSLENDDEPRIDDAAAAIAATRTDVALVLVTPRSKVGRSLEFPLLAYLSGVDLLIGSGGYNTVNECRATATPLLAFARRRIYDRQDRRLLAVESVRDIDELLRRLDLALIGRRGLRAFAPPAYVNGAAEAAGLIDKLS